MKKPYEHLDDEKRRKFYTILVKCQIILVIYERLNGGNLGLKVRQVSNRY